MVRPIFTAIRQTIPVMGLALALGTGAAQADFRGGGAVFDFTPSCAQGGWPMGSTIPARMRHSASEDAAVGLATSQITVAFGHLTEHYSLSGAFEPSVSFVGAVGRQAGAFFVVYPERPLIRVVQRSVVQHVDPAGPNTVQNARALVLRLRIQNFGNIPACEATIAANLVRMN